MTTHQPSFAPPENDTGPRRALLLAGGGMRVAWQAGVLRALAEAGVCFHHADGTSGGTINLAMLFSGLTPVQMCERWRSLRVLDFSTLMPLENYLRGKWIALGDARGITEKVYPHLGIDVAKIRAATGMTGTFNVCNFTDKINEAIPHDQVDMDYLVAGVSLPIFMPPVLKNGQTFTDSVWIKDANLIEAVRRGAEELWLVWCIGNTPEYSHGAFEQYVHMIELSANGALFEEFDRIRELNARIAAGDSPYGQRQPIILHVIKPEYALPLDPDFYLGRIDAATLISLGYRAAKQYLAQRLAQSAGVPFTPEATKMKPGTIGISFRETMAGAFALGATEPAAGAAQGKTAGTTLAMHASVFIDDLARFVADPEHTGSLTGTIDFVPLGTGLPAKSGAFNLFFPADDPQMKLMVYELGFEHQGKEYYLAGHKKVKDDPGLDLWTDTTTLYTTLHQGTDKSAPVIGAGMLHLGVTDLIKLLSTVQVPKADTVAEKTKALTQFGQFFLGELWDTYIKHTEIGR